MQAEAGTPQLEVASRFMAHKGYPDAVPYDVEQLEGAPCWYFYYDVADGQVELEVFWDSRNGRWETVVTTFRAAEHDSGPTGALAGR